MLLFAKCVGAPFEIDKKQIKKKTTKTQKGKKALRKRWKKRRVFNDDNVVKRAKTLFSSFLK